VFALVSFIEPKKTKDARAKINVSIFFIFFPP